MHCYLAICEPGLRHLVGVGQRIIVGIAQVNQLLELIHRFIQLWYISQFHLICVELIGKFCHVLC